MAFLIRAHQPRVAAHIGGEDRVETADRRPSRAAVDCLHQSYPKIGTGPSVQWAGGAASSAGCGPVLGRVWLDAAAPDDQPQLRLRRIAQEHRRAGLGFSSAACAEGVGLPSGE
jgi:hypothetical protein